MTSDTCERGLAVGIGSSAEDPAALKRLFDGFPSDLREMFVLSKDIANGFTRLLAERLSLVSRLVISEASYAIDAGKSRIRCTNDSYEVTDS
jgi:chemotaxis response regulator CheB